MTEALLFPAATHPPWLETPGLDRSGLTLRAATESDLAFLRELYAASRAAELAATPWPEAARRAFCDGQFLLQHRHYVAHFVPAAFLVVLHAGEPIGRLTLHWTADELRIVDILLQPEAQGRGIGSTLLRWTQAVALAAGVDRLGLHVERRNTDACRLYARLGFREEDGGGAAHRRMAWRPRGGGQLNSAW